MFRTNQNTNWLVLMLSFLLLVSAATLLAVVNRPGNGQPGMMGNNSGGQATNRQSGMMGDNANNNSGMMGNNSNNQGSGMMSGSLVANQSSMMGVTERMDGTGMMNGYFQNAPAPGENGFVPGTVSAPRIVHLTAGPGETFSPSILLIQRGETITFVVTSMGFVQHEFMVGQAAAVAADQPGTPEISELSGMQTKTLTYTFDGDSSYAYACHIPGHYEAGMRGQIVLVG